jgi:hypothetical protein
MEALFAAVRDADERLAAEAGEPAAAPGTLSGQT